MNLYLVVSERLTEVVCEDRSVNACHEEEYRIAELIVARSHGHARWLAYESDSQSQHPCLEDMPKMAVRLKRKNVEGDPRIVTERYSGVAYGELWIVGNAPHIGIKSL